MNLVIDPHVHVYPCYMDSVFNILMANLKLLAGENADTELGAVLTEREDCDYYALLVKADQTALSKYGLEKLENFDSYIKLYLNKGTLVLYPGTQVNTTEKIELLGLFTKERPSTKLPLKKAIEFILENGGLPVINWAPGKWTGKRAGIIRNYLVRDPQSRDTLLGISKLLPENFSFPSICKTDGANLPLILGSDPLPFKDEENQAGTVGLILKDLKDLCSAEVKARFCNKAYLHIGKRNGMCESAFRVLKNEITRRV